MGWPFTSRKNTKRRVKPEARQAWWQRIHEDGTAGSLAIAAVFCLLAAMIFVLREEAPAYRVHQWVPQDIHSRVDFTFHDSERLAKAREMERDRVLPIYQPTTVWASLEERLKDMPDRLGGRSLDDISANLREQFAMEVDGLATQLDSAALTAFEQFSAEGRREGYADAVRAYVDALHNVVVLPARDIVQEIQRQESIGLEPRIVIAQADPSQPADIRELRRVYPSSLSTDLINEVKRAAAASFPTPIQRPIAAYTLNMLREHPTHVFDADATAEARNQAVRSIPESRGQVAKTAGALLVEAGELDAREYKLLKAENDAWLATQTPWEFWRRKIGMLALVCIVTAALGGYIKHYQPRIIRNHARGFAIAVLLLSMLLLAQLAAIGTGPLYLFGIAPTILVAMILAIAYDQRFAMGVASTHALLVTAALGQGVGFFVVLFIGVLTCCYLLDEIRSRSRLIEIGGATGLAMMLATLAVGLVNMQPREPFTYVGLDVLYAGGAGIAVGFCVLGILPFIERAFRITTGMTLLELADASHPLLRRLSVEAPGTYNHSLQVATLSEAAAEAIGANSLLCRVGSYYHDVGKINKADYFIENQSDGVNRHINLSPSVSLLIIIGHVKDGVELAKEYGLPPVLIQFIQQHHGTTLVEYFYRQAIQRKDEQAPDHPDVSETQYRYPGPRPRTRECGIVMLADACESATRAMGDISPARIETLVHDMVMKRLLDGQFEECELTMREIELIERSLVKTLINIYHGRIAYPSSDNTTTGSSSQSPVVKTA